MKILFYFGHPAQYLFFRETIRRLKVSDKNEITLLIKTKDVLEDLLNEDGFEYINILPEERRRSKMAIAISLFKRNIKLVPLLFKKKPDLIIGTDASIAQMGKLFRINRVTTTEDDYEVIKTLGKLTYPFTQIILCPQVCGVGKWDSKKVGYKGYMKLGYLHPNVFTPDPKVWQNHGLNGNYVLIRIARLTAHHDFGIQGINYPLLAGVIALLEKRGYKICISSEGHLDPKYKAYLLQNKPKDMHHILAGASMLISDSQSMSVEAAVLGVPSLRLSDFAGKISVLEELEHVYALTYALLPKDEENIYAKIKEFIDTPDLKNVFALRRAKMLSEKIDVTEFLLWFLQNYPSSAKIMKDDPGYQNKFLSKNDPR